MILKAIIREIDTSYDPRRSPALLHPLGLAGYSRIDLLRNHCLLLPGFVKNKFRILMYLCTLRFFIDLASPRKQKTKVMQEVYFLGQASGGALEALEPLIGRLGRKS